MGFALPWFTLMQRPGAKRFGRAALAILLVLLLVACTTNHTRRADNLKADARIGAGKSLVILEADVELSELLAGGVEEPRMEWTQAAEKHINAAIEGDLRTRSIRLLPRADVSKREDLPDIKQLELLAQTVGFSIIRFQISQGFRLPTKRDGFDWTIGPNAAKLKAAYGADYAILTFVRDSYASSGRKAMAVLGFLATVATGVNVTASTGQRVGYTMLIDLSTGRVVWVNFMASGGGDLRNDADAKKVVKQMLNGLPL